MSMFVGYRGLAMKLTIIVPRPRNISSFSVSKSSPRHHHHHHQQYRHNSISTKHIAGALSSSTRPKIVDDKTLGSAEFEMRRNATPTKVEQNETNKVFQVIVEGNIGSGKTTFLDIFSNSSGGNQPERRPFIVPEPIEAWRNVNGQNVFQLLAEDTKRWCFTFQSYVLLTMAKNHALMPPSGSGLKLMERSLFSARHCFVENLYRTKQLQPIEYHILDRWYRTLVSDVTVDLIIYLRTDPEVVYDRIRARARPEESRLTREYLKALHELHEAWLVRHEFGQPAGEARVVTIDANVPLEQIVSVYKDKTSTILAQHDHSFHRHV